ncbi:hemerythrin domain-containing protein [Streptosporangium sp. G11]|uniref:hemerythrin domain-containing protein n=1 Tax=Streptosporangium sp. G11 TaxID=3436926 RepID=UPI003EBF08EF
MNATDRPYTHEMVVVHRVFRRESGLMPHFVRAVPEGDTVRAAEIAEHYLDYAEGLHHHHTAEDELVWPLLLSRVRPRAGMVERMEDQHQRIDATLARIAEVLPEWRLTASKGTGEKLAITMEEHRAALVEHLDDEERYVLALIAEHMSVPEWEAVGARAVEQIAKEKLMLSMGAILEEATPAERRFFLGKLPAIARLLWKTVGRRQYAKQVLRLRGPLAA